MKQFLLNFVSGIQKNPDILIKHYDKILNYNLCRKSFCCEDYKKQPFEVHFFY